MITELDDTRLLYTKRGPLLAGPRPIYLVGLITLLHEEIADELALEMDALGGETPCRSASPLDTLRAHFEPLLASTSAHVERRCLTTVSRYEARVVQRFVTTLDEVAGLSRRI